MNYAFMVNDSISPSTQRSTGNTQTSTGFSTFRDLLERTTSASEDEANVSPSGNNLSVNSSVEIDSDKQDLATENPETDTEEKFAQIEHLMMLKLIQKNPDEDEEEESESVEDEDMVKAETTEADDARAEYQRLLQEIERARDLALEQNGTDKNKNALGAEDLETEEEEEKTILLNGQVEEAEEESTKTA